MRREPRRRLPLAHVYFPETAVCSIIARMADGAGVEVGTIGNEGLVGLAALLDTAASANQTLAQIPGTALRIPAAGLVAAVDARPALRRLLHRYTQAYLTQVAQGAACNRLHGIEARCARWLLMTHDRVGGADRFPLAQEFLAIMLGVRRSGVTVAAGALHAAGLSATTAAAFACSTARGWNSPRASATGSSAASSIGCYPSWPGVRAVYRTPPNARFRRRSPRIQGCRTVDRAERRGTPWAETAHARSASATYPVRCDAARVRRGRPHQRRSAGALTPQRWPRMRNFGLTRHDAPQSRSSWSDRAYWTGVPHSAPAVR